MAYRRGPKLIREMYEDQFPAMDSREVTVHRVVNIVEKRSQMPRQGLEFDRGYDDQWYDSPQNYQDARECHEDGGYPHNDRRYFEENHNFGSFRRSSPPPRNEAMYPQQRYNRDDLRHQLNSRHTGRAGPYFHKRSRGLGPPQRENRHSQSGLIGRDRSPIRKDTHSPALVRSGSNSSNRSFSPNRDKSYTHQQRNKPNVSSHVPSSSAEGSPHSSGFQEKPAASAAESEEVVAASMEPKPTPKEDFKARRLEAIQAKALEIEKHYRQDCETFRTVVKMLVAKEPNLDNLLQAPLDENLSEIKQRCLDALRHFVKELDEVLEQPDTSEQAKGEKPVK
ncbi:hypothetical protein PAMA_019642 [Pampus argenteus]